MSVEENKAIFRRYVEEIPNQGNMKVADEIFDRYISHQPDGSTLERGPEDVKRFTGEFHSAFPDLHVSIEDQIAEGDKVVSHFTIRGTHQGEFRGMSPTGKEIALTGVTTFRFSPEGKVVETWDSYDQMSLMRQSTEQELRLARSIQRASLPEEVPQLEGWRISPYYRPTREVGGDFYDFHFLSNGRLRLVVGDAKQARACSARYVSHLRHASGSLTSLGLLLAARGTGSGQRDVVCSPPLQHVRHLLLRYLRL